MNFEEFKSKLSDVRTAQNKRASYKNITLRGNTVQFIRVGKSDFEKVSVKQLYSLYLQEDFINTVIARKYISGRVYSPSVAILKAAGLVSHNGYRVGFVSGDILPKVEPGGRIIHIISSKKKPASKPKTGKIQDETLFFKALNAFLGANRLYSKSVGSSIDSSDLYLADDYSKYNFKSDTTKAAFQDILKALNGTDNFNNKSLSHFVDGLIHDHPKLGNRIVEFDEEQHFTPARKDALMRLSKSMKIPYADRFVAICNNLEYMSKVLKKHRIKPKLVSVPENFLEFTTWLEDANVSESNYIASKPAFNYNGGRIAQRAYYDCLRDVAHLSEFNKMHKLKPPLRFAKYTFENKYKMKFSELSQENIIEGIKEILEQDFAL